MSDYVLDDPLPVECPEFWARHLSGAARQKDWLRFRQDVIWERRANFLTELLFDWWAQPLLREFHHRCRPRICDAKRAMCHEGCA